MTGVHTRQPMVTWPARFRTRAGVAAGSLPAASGSSGNPEGSKPLARGRRAAKTPGKRASSPVDPGQGSQRPAGLATAGPFHPELDVGVRSQRGSSHARFARHEAPSQDGPLAPARRAATPAGSGSPSVATGGVVASLLTTGYMLAPPGGGAGTGSVPHTRNSVQRVTP